MKLDDYPPQEPLSEAGQALQRRVLAPQRRASHARNSHSAPTPISGALVPRRPADGRVLLFWHGGGWTSRLQGMDGVHGARIHRAGVTFVSAGYGWRPARVSRRPSRIALAPSNGSGANRPRA